MLFKNKFVMHIMFIHLVAILPAITTSITPCQQRLDEFETVLQYIQGLSKKYPTLGGES
jgi:hypothetical protein